ncbi:MAG: 50S ribosomal protein L25/general stress protein Ctc [Candidatus Fluviicola riflensis]|nr:MAG: 50S ribosomal protein L25 [Candidatus Fluviicola riflensis]OGS77705.1 MAG: 50S ribosomal protein L25/general stress protein Ctc [Candidatus Fluviicola riflensis]OGS84288.1 MAG: 50S ribosomal protein L25/general stress protein Ctc [Fluviicola sp. RIFCSPHIGHO2_12_FULL_43_24]OGS84771.1 MAG: 50S ribosomal protein L25/general stress protein Ctc [Fluviicola sp. RIFCSPHIGHO2_01_FULL_43_53]
MKVSQLSGSLRSNVGKKDAKATRDAGLVPCVLYGQGTQTHFAVKDIAIEKLVFNPDVFQVELDIDGTKATAIIQELQQNPITDKVTHIDFLQLDPKKPVKIALPVRLTGASRGVLAGGKLLQVYRRLKVIALPGDLPEAIIVDITKLRIGQSIRVGDLETEAKGIKFSDAKSAVVVSVKMARGASKAAETDEEEED